MKRDCVTYSCSMVFSLAVFLGFCAGCARNHAPVASAPATIKTTSDLPQQVLQEPVPSVAPPRTEISCFMIPYYPHPERMELCGEQVPLNDQDVSERFDKEFTLVVYNQAQVYLWLKRMERYFPWIEDRLRSYGLPNDLKFVAVAESDLLPNACSPKGAAGPWQFMSKTGTRYGLDQTRDCDERYDFERASSSAFRYLDDLHRRFGNWALAIAAYNCGEGRVQDEMLSQGIRDYYHLKLPLETERYIMRILAIKAILSNPSKYGYALPPGEGYPEIRSDRASLTVSSSTPIQQVAAAAGTTYKEIKRLNPSLRSDEIPPGSHQIKVPEGKGRSIEQNFRPPSYGPSASSADMEENTDPAPPPPHSTKAHQKNLSYHVVKRGDTLTNIARRYNVSVEDLKRANKIRSNNIALGERLVIP